VQVELYDLYCSGTLDYFFAFSMIKQYTPIPLRADLESHRDLATHAAKGDDALTPPWETSPLASPSACRVLAWEGRDGELEIIFLRSNGSTWVPRTVARQRVEVFP
jgi:hypothetical protein